MAKVLDKITENINQIIVDSGFEMYDISFEKEGKNNFLRIFVDSINENIVDLEVCVLITKNVNKCDKIFQKIPVLNPPLDFPPKNLCIFNHTAATLPNAQIVKKLAIFYSFFYLF